MIVLGQFLYGHSSMNTSEVDSEWSGAPDMYEVEITESHRLSDANLNETNTNGTLTFQGELSPHFFFFPLPNDSDTVHSHLSQQETKSL